MDLSMRPLAMWKKIFMAAFLIGVVGALETHPDEMAANHPREPYFDASRNRREYAGPGREAPAPEGLREVLIGYFGPDDPDHPEGGDIWLATHLAIEEANQSGGHQGLPFRLRAAWSDQPWGTGVSQMARMAYAEPVWAILGSIDGSSTHLLEQVVAKARLTLVSPASTDKTVNLANVAWAFSCLPADNLQAKRMTELIANLVGRQGIVLISATDHDSRVSSVEYQRALARRDIAPSYHFQFGPQTQDFSELVDLVATSNPRAIVLLARPLDSARLLRALRETLTDIPIFGGPALGRRAFMEEAGPAADGALFPLLCNPSQLADDFARRFQGRYGRLPDCTTRQAYDAARLLIDAIREAGLNRARIRDAVEGSSPWSGVTGTIRWDSLGMNRRDVHVATIRKGQVVPLAFDGTIMNRPVGVVHSR